jgi:hypothetical protein
LEALRQANLKLSLQVRALEASLSQINTEHCELVKQVVMAKLEREELEDELVKCECSTRPGLKAPGGCASELGRFATLDARADAITVNFFLILSFLAPIDKIAYA